MAKQLSDAEFLRDTAHNRLIGNMPYEIARRVIDISYRLEALDAQEPSEAECIVWALKNEVLLHGLSDWESGVEWVYRFLRSTEVFRVKKFDGQLPILSPAVFADIRRRMKETPNDPHT